MSLDLETDTLEELDFTLELPCEHLLHEKFHADEPAWAHLRIILPCGHEYTCLICYSGWKLIGTVTHAQCSPKGCSQIHHRDDVKFILTPLQ